MHTYMCVYIYLRMYMYIEIHIHKSMYSSDKRDTFSLRVQFFSHN